MYKKRLIETSGFAEGEFTPFVDRVVIARPMSYYVKGGVDLDGISRRKSLPPAFDDSEAIVSGEVDVFTDPTLGKLDLMDMASTMASESQARALKDGAGEPNSD